MSTIISRDAHIISRDNISKNALKVLYRLQEAGYRSCLVGGGVRDLLLELSPKDFDVATDATPEEVRALFKNCRLVGRRFRLAHVRFGREVIEVATFRGSGSSDERDAEDIEDFDDETLDNETLEPESSMPIEDTSPKHKDQRHETNEAGRITRDNIYGTIEEDAFRRDLTINALYYDIEDFSVVDYCGGVKDIEQRRIRLIGDPKTRYQEDPVRMLRVLRFASKLDFTIEASTEAAIAECAPLLKSIPAARLVDEGLKMFMGGQAWQNYNLMREHQLLDAILPFIDQVFAKANDAEQQYFSQIIKLGLQNSDDRVANNQAITPYYLLAVLLWPPVVQAIQPMLASGMHYQDALHQASDELVIRLQKHISIPRRYSTPMKEVWLLQSRLERTRGKRAERVLEHARFRAAYDFLLLRGLSGEDVGTAVKYWTRLQDIDIGEHDSPKNNRHRSPRKRSRRSEPAAN